MQRLAHPVAAAVAAALCSCGPGDAGPPPNVVVVVVDTLRADHLTVYGYPRPTSPNLERLARDSVVFDNAFTVMSHTLPAHVSLVTGVHPATHQVLSNGWVYRGPYPTLATRLREAGYTTGGFVSGFPLDRQSGFARGFDVYEDVVHRGERHSKVNGELTNRRALGWLRKQGERPFFLLVHYYDTHTPYTWPTRGPLPLPRDERLEKRLEEIGAAGRTLASTHHVAIPFRGANLDLPDTVNLYDNQILRVDALFEEIRAELERSGLLDRTLVVVTSDHGEGLGQHAYFSHGLHLYEEQLRIPLIVRPPPSAGWSPGRVEGVVSLLDVAPTVLDLAGLPPDPALQGRSLRSVVDGGDTAPERWLVAQRRWYPARAPAFMGRFAASTGLAALRGDGPLKYMRDGDGREELFDLDADPLETLNLVDQRGEDAARLRRILDERLGAITADEPVAVPELDAETRRRLEELGYIQ